MSFSISGSGHTDTPEDLQAVKDALQEAADAVGAHVSGGVFSITMTGQDHESQAISETFSTAASE